MLNYQGGLSPCHTYEASQRCESSCAGLVFFAADKLCGRLGKETHMFLASA